MRREYDWEENPDDKNTQKMGDASWIDRKEAGLGSKGQTQSPKFAPFYLGVRNDLDSEVSCVSLLSLTGDQLSVCIVQ